MLSRVELEIGMRLTEVVSTPPQQGPITSNILDQVPLLRSLGRGTADGQANEGYFQALTLTAAQTVNRDFAGAITDTFGNTITLAKLDCLVLVNFSTVDSVSIGPLAAANPITGAFVGATAGAIVGPGTGPTNPGVYIAYYPQGLAIGAGASDTIQIINNDGANSTDIYWGFFGRNA